MLECVKLVHNALPEINLDNIDTSISFLGHRFSAPILIDSMTGGTAKGGQINSILSSVAEELGLGMGVGSQRAGLRSEKLAETYKIVRKNAPSIFLSANIGGAQLSQGLTIKDAKNLIDMIDANALIVHLNPLQELIQPEGEPESEKVLQSICDLVEKVNVPVIIKEVGSGISKEVAIQLEMAGVSAINVAGSGGTSWAGVEQIRAKNVNDISKAELGELFWDWGIPTAASILEVRRSVKIPIIASGGIRNGVDISKSISLGANICGLAHPMLKKASESKDALMVFIEKLIREIKSTMYLTGSKNVNELSAARKVITGPLKDWL